MPCNAGTHHGNTFWINLDPCGLICGMMTWVLIAFGMYATTHCVILPWLGDSLHGYFHIAAFNSICVIATYNHWRAMTTDPGAVPKDAKPLPTDIEEMDLEASGGPGRVMRYRKFCRRCQAFKPSRAHHCSMCNRCIVKMDHHCPWVNNCVGIGNHKLFLLFIFWINVISCYALVLIIAKHLTCSMWRGQDGCRNSPRCFILTIFLVVEAVLFGMFTLCMCADQIPAITTNETQIDRLKNQKHEVQTEINEVFGTPGHTTFALSWLLPTPTMFPESCRHLVFGYCVDSNAAAEAQYDMDSELVPLTSGRGELSDADGAAATLTSNLLQAHNSASPSPAAASSAVNNSDNDRPSSPSSTSSLNGTVRKRTNV